MSFAGGSGHRSPFTERAKATKSHLSPRRSSAASTANARGPQQSLFMKESAFGGKVSQLGDSSAKVSHSRNGPQSDVIKEPTTPTRASEGSIVKGNRRDEFSSFNNRRVGTPVKTPRTAFGTVTPRSPKRPYMGSPKYQKVLMERPAFYNSPAAAGEPSTDSGKKAVSISELQKRLKRFLQDENIPAARTNASSDNLDEVPCNISRSPRVNPLFHHDDTVLQVAKGGVAFTAGVDFPEEEPCTHSKENDAGFHVAFTAGESFTVAPEATPLAPQLEGERNDEPSEASETERALGPEDFPVHSETEDGSQAEEACDEVAVPAVCDRIVVPAACDEIVVPAVCDEVVVPAVGDSEGILTSAIVEVPIDEAALEIVEEKVEEVNVEAEKESVGVAIESKVDAKAECSVEEEEVEEFEILESWSQRFLKFVVLAVMVACMMGFMVLASGSQGLLPTSMVAGPFSGSLVTPSVIPVSVGFMGLGREHEGIPCLPSVHLGLKLLSTPSKNDAPQLESVSSYQPVVHNVMDLDELKTATDYYKELQGRLFSDVAGLTSESAETYGTMDGASLEHVLETAAPEEVAEDVSASWDFPEVAGTEVILSSEDVSAFEDVAEDVSASGGFAEVAAIEEIMPSEDVAESQATIEEISELVVDESEASEESLILESPQIILDAAAGPETDMEMPADVESDVLNVESDAVPTSEFVPSETTETLSFDSQTAEATPSVEEPSIEVPTIDDAHPISDDVVVLPTLPSITGEIATEDRTVGSSVEDLVEEHLIEEPQSGGAVSIEEPLSDATCPLPVSEVAVFEEPILEELGAEGSLPVATIGLIVVTLASAVALMLNMRKSTAVAEPVNLFPGTADTHKNMGSPVAWPSSRSVFDSHIPDRDELDAITSPLKGIRAPKRYGMDSSFYGLAEPALSAPGVFKAPSARVVVQKPATTWHPAMNGGSTISGSSYRQTASYIPSIPSESGISNSTRGASDTDSICESALTMGAEEWEHLGSFTTTELVSVVTEGGEQHKVRTPVRRSQRIRNRVSPLPERFNDFY